MQQNRGEGKCVFVWKRIKTAEKAPVCANDDLPINSAAAVSPRQAEPPPQDDINEDAPEGAPASAEPDPPSIFALKRADLFSFVRLEALYVQAVEGEIIVHSASMPRLWVAAALTARRAPKQPVAMFGEIVTKSRWADLHPSHLRWADHIIAYHSRKSLTLFEA